MSENSKEADKQMQKKIFISADGFLAVFELLPPRQLGLGIALISHRFDCYVDEHFKTRRWSLENILIVSKIGENSATGMEIISVRGQSLPIPKEPMPKKVIGFAQLFISYIDQNVIEFLCRCSSLFANCAIHLVVQIKNDRILEFVLRDIWPLLKDGIRGLQFVHPSDLRHLRRFGHSSILSDCPSLRFVLSYCDVSSEFPSDGSANALDGQPIAKWLFSPHPNAVPKVLKCYFCDQNKWPSKIEGLKAAFSSASSRADFIIVILRLMSNSVMPFDLANELTGERLTLKSANDNGAFMLIRCPISRDENKWTNWEKEAIEWNFNEQWNEITISIE
ncbi:hypothetical protein niasHT_003699 [Heterodera trifolii]|uniref:Uncharacterized protein n=1 Tax=Heterodera trifolii TaxID=157864 RepID=A0ABD2M900_9BILA